MHPTIRVVLFLVFATFVAAARPGALVFASVLLAALYMFDTTAPSATPASRTARLHTAWRMLRRLRWLLLSIVVLYGWFTPGAPLLHWEPGLAWIPTYEGLREGALRGAVLVLMVLAISHVLQASSRAGLVGALRWLSTPLRVVGLDRDRLALRVVLVLETLGEVQTLVAARVRALRAQGVSRTAAAALAAEVFADVVQRAEQAPPQWVWVPRDRPRAYEWLYPALLAAAFVLVLRFAA